MPLVTIKQALVSLVTDNTTMRQIVLGYMLLVTSECNNPKSGAIIQSIYINQKDAPPLKNMKTF